MKRQLLAVMVFFAVLPLANSSWAETFLVEPGDDWSVIEAAEAGDIVEIAPGTYQFRVYLDNVGTAENPIIIRAQDPEDRPVWDLVGDSDETHVDDWPGSYTAGDRGRGCWQVGADGAYYEISGIVFQNCRAPSSAGLRMINSGPVTVRDCLFQYNTNGLTGASEDLIVEHSEFFQNGKTITSGNMTHHIYIFGGRFTLRYSYLHDGHEGQAFHIRARESVLEYNWIARPASYVGDVMTCEQFCGDAPVTQTMLLRGNVIIQGQPNNGSQILVLFRDAEADTDATMDLTLVHNTIIGTPRSEGQDHFLINMRNDTVSTYAHLYNNIIYNVGDVGGAREAGADNWGIDGRNNWLSTGTEASELTASIVGDAPGFVNIGDLDFTLVEGGAAVGEADDTAPLTPDREYYQDEIVAMQWRPRASALDIGAFERGTDSMPVGPYGDPPIIGMEPGADMGLDPGPDMGDTPLDSGVGEDTSTGDGDTGAVAEDVGLDTAPIADLGGGADATAPGVDTSGAEADAAPTDGGSGSANTSTDDDGCSCATAPTHTDPLFFVLFGAIGVFLRRRAR